MATAAIGHNMPPPIEGFRLHIEELFAEATNWLDGSGVQSEADAEGVAKLLDMARRAGKDADAQRAAEKRPHDDAAKRVQADWKPLLDRCELVSRTCKDALRPYLERQETEKRAMAEVARREAEEQAHAAREALATAGTDVSARADAEALLKGAGKAQAAAKRAANDKPQTTGGSRAVGLRSVWSATLADPSAALKHYRERRPGALKEWLQGQADFDVRSGLRAIPGFEIAETKVAV